MDSRIPKASGLKKPTPVVFDFSNFKCKTDIVSQPKQQLPLTELNNKTFGAISRSRSPDLSSFRSKPIVTEHKLRRSKSAVDLRTLSSRPGLKRPFKPTLDSNPIKRQKMAPMKPLIKTQEKKAAILNTLRSESSSAVVKMVDKKPLTKSASTGATAKARVPAAPAARTISKTMPPVKPTAATTTTKAPLSKPAPYDFKARFALANERCKTLKEKNDEQKEQIQALEELNDGAEQREKDLMEKLEAIEHKLMTANEEKEKLKSEIEQLKGTNGNLMTKNRALADTLAQTSEELSDLKVRQAKLEKTAEEHEVLKIRKNELEHNLEETSHKLQLSQEQLYTINHERMVLHNMVLDLRGNIRVFARVRPPISCEQDKMMCVWSFTDETSLEITSNQLVPSGKKQSKYDFAFDQVFNPNTSQDEIFEMVSPLIQSAMDGYNVCIFAYGQTGSGKTFTMDGEGQNLGIIPRTVQLLFSSMETASILGWSYTVTASFLEIYNEVLYDLLSNEDKEIEIRMANAKSKTEIYVSNVTQTEVHNAAGLYELMRVARSNRATAATAGNERSSRSHAVTRLEVVGRHASRPESLVGFINLVDLAGSESPKTSTRMDETKNINRSLSELSNVILALVQRNEHIPYRNSKLTHLLMPSLGGNSKTLMFVNVSPLQEHFGESVNSLRFAAQVNSCKMAKAKRNRQMNVS